ncbi:MAG: tetratricopeptide repeat protein [Myxococcota bacterium]
MGEIDWTSAVAVLGGGLALGLALVMVSRKGESAAPARDLAREAKLEDLKRRRELLVEQLRDLDDMQSAGDAVAAEERSRLEREAATVLRDLSRLESGEVAPQRSTAQATTGGMSPQLRGALQGGLIVGFFALMFFVLQSTTRPREEGMGITGNDPRPAATPMGGQGRPAPADHPQAGEDTPRLQAARAAVAADPGSMESKVELAFALADAGQWMEAYKASEEILALEPGQPDALMVQSSIRLVMGQLDKAIELADKVITNHPTHTKALAYRGMLAFRAGDRPGAIANLERARQIAGPDETLDAMIAEVKTKPLPTEAGGEGGEGAMPPGHPPTGDEAAGGMPAGHPPIPGAETGGMPAGHPAIPGAAQPQAAATTGDVAVAGTIRLADGVTAPPGATLFVIARRPDVPRGPPAATRRYPATSFPLAFSLGQDNVMLGGPFPEEFTLSARLDTDGNAMTRAPGDLEGAVTGTVKKGTGSPNHRAPPAAAQP